MASPLVHVCVLAALLLAGVVLRTRVGLFKRLFIPASLIAGCLALLLGQYGLSLIPANMNETFSALPPMLIAIVFAPMLMGTRFPSFREVVNLAGPQLLFGYIGGFFLIAIPLLVTGLVLTPLWQVDEMFGTLVEVGFVGGHGTAGGMAEVYSNLGWQEGGPLGLTTATIGLFVGIVCGLIIINHGVKTGRTSFLKSTAEISARSTAAILPGEQRTVAAHITISKDVVEPLAFHFGLIAIAILLGVVLLFGLESATSLNMPLFPMAMIGGLIVQSVISKTAFGSAVDAGTLKLIQGLALELLIVSAVATISIPVVIEYALPLLLVCVASTGTLLAHFYILGPRLFKDNWFEHSILNFGTLAGVTAVGLMLLRTVDPDMKSDAAKAYALRAPFISPIAGGGLLTSVMPVLVATHGAVGVGLGFLFAIAILLILARVSGFWQNSVR